jgi:adenylyltransferase/sulfurtransferase
MPERPEQENNCGSEGIFSPVAGILGSLQANEVLKTILNLKDDLNNNILLFNALKSSLRKIKINSNPSCQNKCQK